VVLVYCRRLLGGNFEDWLAVAASTAWLQLSGETFSPFSISDICHPYVGSASNITVIHWETLCYFCYEIITMLSASNINVHWHPLGNIFFYERSENYTVVM